MHDVFISYARENRKRAKRLADVLVEERGWSIWFDEALQAGDEYPRVIERALEQVRCVLVVWSKDAVASRWVIAEASEGWNRGILVPVLLDDADPPLPFRQTEAIDFSDWKGDAKAPQVLKLIEAIDRALLGGTRPEDSELVARESRRRKYRQRKLLRRAVAAGGIAALVGAGWFGWHVLDYRAAAEQIADRADQLRAEVRELNDEERNRTWGSVLLESPERQQKLELATLVAAEAVRHARTGRTQKVLADLLAMSPWSDRSAEIELKGPLNALEFSADGALLVGGGGVDGTIIWTMSNNAVTRIPHGGVPDAFWKDRSNRSGYRGGATIDIEASGKRVATAGPDQTAAVWDAQSGRELLRLPHESIVTALAFIPGTDRLATVSENGIVRVWDLASARELWQVEQGSTSYWIAASDSGRYVVSTSGQTARLWRSDTGAALPKLDHENRVRAARFSADETLLVTFGEDIETTVWDLPGATVRKRIPVLAGERSGALFGPDDRTLVIGSTDENLVWWGLDQKEEELSVPVGDGGYIFELASTPDRETFVVADNVETMATAWDFASRRQLRQMPYWGLEIGGVAISRDGRLMASSGFDGGNYVLEITELRPDDPLAYACRKVKRNLMRTEWLQYFGPDDPYRPTCPQIAAPNDTK